MIRYILTALLLSTATLAATQDDDLTDLLNIGLVMPTEQKGFDDVQLSKIETKILSILSKNGISSQGVADGIVCYPVAEIYNEGDANTGLANIKVVDINFTLFVKQVDEKAVFTSTTIRVQGSGTDRNRAINNAISNLKPDEKKWSDFAAAAKKKIAAYYARMCPTLIAQADQYAKTDQTGRAFGQLMNIPKEVPCFKDAQKKALEVYKIHIDRVCAQALQRAKAYLAANDYRAALGELAYIDPASKCYPEANSLVDQTAKQVDEQFKREWDLMVKVYSDQVELEKYRWKAIAEVAAAYWRSQHYDYNVIVVK
jgi:hypothetical protein